MESPGQFSAKINGPEVDLFSSCAPEQHADAVRLARETGLRIGDLVELERSEIKRAPDGSRTIILRPNKRRRRIVNMPLTPRPRPSSTRRRSRGV